MAFERSDPPLDVRLDINAAMLCLTLVQLLGGKNTRKYKLSDFVIKYGPKQMADPGTVRRKLRTFLNTMVATQRVRKRKEG